MATGAQIRMARAGLGWDVRRLAKEAGVSTNTITRLEKGADAHESTRRNVVAALESAGVQFLGDDGVRVAALGVPQGAGHPAA